MRSWQPPPSASAPRLSTKIRTLTRSRASSSSTRCRQSREKPPERLPTRALRSCPLPFGGFQRFSFSPLVLWSRGLVVPSPLFAFRFQHFSLSAFPPWSCGPWSHFNFKHFSFSPLPPPQFPCILSRFGSSLRDFSSWAAQMHRSEEHTSEL